MVRKLISTVKAIQKLSGERRSELLSTGVDLSNLEEVKFSSGDHLLLDRTDTNTYPIWSDLLRTEDLVSELLYIEFDENTNVISELLTPTIDQVRDIQKQEQRSVIWLSARPSPTFVLTGNANHDSILLRAEAALENKLSVCVFINPKDDEVLEIAELKKNQIVQLFDINQLLVAAGVTQTISQEQAQQIFAHVAAWVCPALPTANLNCVPFNYPPDCCYARAHKMCEYIAGLNISCGKVWNYGNLCVPTVNHPTGKVKWWYHVAPIVRVGVTETVIDPSMFNRPVTTIQWVTAQNDLQAVQERTPWQVYTRGRGGAAETSDPDLRRTNLQLKVHRNSLRSMHKGHPGNWVQSACP